MATFDDRPVSVYDNLNNMNNNGNSNNSVYNNTPTRAKVQIASTGLTSSTPLAGTATMLATATSTTNASTLAHSPYSDISFTFNDNGKQHQQQQQPYQELLPNGNQSFNQQQRHVVTPKQVQPNTAESTTYCITPITTTPPPPNNNNANNKNNNKLSQQLTTNAKTTNVTSTTATATALTASPVQRPLSQHSQSELYEASHSIAAVKAALNDAKSKFFGLNGYTQDNNNSNNNNTTTTTTTTQTTKESQQRPRVQIITPSPAKNNKTIPKYQNIPENSALFRDQPPELPPKPRNHQNSSNSTNNTTTTTTATAFKSPSFLSSQTVAQTHTMPTAMPLYVDHSSLPSTSTGHSASPARIFTHSSSNSSYQPLPLNDIETATPSQAVYMTTTVPQNIKGSKIAGRHTPTRNSLRHSRMLVVNNKNYQGVPYPNPLNFKRPNLARWLLMLQLFLGILILSLSIWIFVLSSSAPIQVVPYWSGLALLMAGIVGLTLIRYQRIKRHKVRENCFQFLRADSYLLSLLAVLLSCIAVICATITYARFTASTTRCVASNILLEHGACTCTFNANINVTNANAAVTGDILTQSEDQSYKVEYRDMSCEEIKYDWAYSLLASIVLNSLGFIVSILYIVLLACCRLSRKKRTNAYTSVHTSTF